MTTRKQVRDRIILDDQQRAANGQFGSGGGASSRATSFAGNSAVAKKAQNASAKHSNIGREMVQAAANAKSPQYAKTMRMGAVAAQNKSAAESKKARQALGIQDTCKGIKGLLDALDAAVSK